MVTTVARFISAKAIVSARSYTIAEAASTVGVTPQTIHNWIAVGLSSMTSSRPILIRGSDLKQWIKARRRERTSLSPLEFMCLGCKAPRTPYGGMADCSENNGASLRLTALCPTCGSVITRIISHKDLPLLRQVFDIRTTNGSTA